MTPKQTAVQAYAEAERRLRILMSHFDQHLEAHKRRFINDSDNWGYVGDLHEDIKRFKEMLGIE